MSKIEKLSGTSEYACIQDELHGAFTGQECGDVVYSQNMYIDREQNDGTLESIPGARRLLDLDYRINALHLHRAQDGSESIIAHAGENLFKIPVSIPNDPEYPEEPIARIENTKSFGAQVGASLFITDGTSITEIDGYGDCHTYNPEAEFYRYIPTTYANGAQLEHRNLLTYHFYETLNIELADDYTYGSPELTYSVIDREKKQVAVTGIRGDHSDTVYIPGHKEIGGIRYTVTEIAPNAFSLIDDIVRVVTNRGLLKIGSAAFMGMLSLDLVHLSDTVQEIGDYCFAGCDSLSHIHIGSGLERFGTAPFSGCFDFSIDYAGSKDMFNCIENTTVIGNKTPRYYAHDPSITVQIPLCTECEDVEEVYIDNVVYPFEAYYSGRGVVIHLEDRSVIAGAEVRILGIYPETGGILSNNLGMLVGPEGLVYGCKICHSYDGRLFLSGHPNFPGVVLYSAADANGNVIPMYFSDHSYFVAGGFGQEVTALSTAGQSVAVFTRAGGDDGNLFLFKPRSGELDICYKLVASYGHSATSAAINHQGECISVSELGVSRFRGTTGKNTDFELISDPISSLLWKHDYKDMMLASWGRYIAVCAGTDVFLADTTERLCIGDRDRYEWFPLSGIGAFISDIQLFVYADEPYGEYEVRKDKVGEPAWGMYIQTLTLPDGEQVSYIIEDGKKYRLYQTEYHYHGRLTKPTAMLGVGKLLFYGCEYGALCVFNTDMRGVAPPHVAKREGFDAEEYKSRMGDLIHPFYYTITGHFMDYKLVLRDEDCGKCYLEKSTVRNSTVIKLKTLAESGAYCTVIYDGERILRLGRIRSGRLDFGELSFNDLTLASKSYALTTLLGGDTPWHTKQIIFSSEGAHSPFGIRSVAYRFTVADTTRNKTI